VVSLSEWPECRSLYSEQELADFSSEVKAKGLPAARPKRSVVLPKETSPLERVAEAAPGQAEQDASKAVGAWALAACWRCVCLLRTCVRSRLVLCAVFLQWRRSTATWRG
jgi:hypothetical protein